MMRRSIRLATIGVLSLFVVGCQGKVTEEDLQKWTHNDLGLERIGEVVADPEQPKEIRLRALEVVVEKGFATRVRGMLDDVAPGADRDALVAGFEERLLEHLEGRTRVQYDAKDALLILQRYLGPEEFEEVQEAVAEWAFRDIDWDTPEADVKQKIESRIASGQIGDLGPYGWEGAAIVASHGFDVDKLLEYLAGAGDPEATRYLLRGWERFHREIGIRLHHLEALSRTATPEAAAYLLRVYMDEDYDADIRNSAFNWAAGMLDGGGLAGEGTDPVVERLLELMKRDEAQDRWLGAVHTVRLSGAEHLGEVLARFEDDGIYTKAAEPTQKSVLDFCLDIRDLGHGDETVPVFVEHATEDNPVSAAISVVCLKANGAQQAREVLAEVAEGSEEPTSLARFLGEGYTLEGLARNALEGLDRMKDLERAEEAGELDEVEARNKRLIVTFELKATGEAYEDLVAQRFQSFEKEYEEDPEAFQ